jgi:hypothetical protein
MHEQNKTRVELNVILQKRPGFFIRWGLVAFVLVALLLILLADYMGYDLFLLFGKK